MTAHVFYYKFPKIKVDLVHQEIERFHPRPLNPPPYPNGTFINADGQWWQKTAALNHNHVQENQVPKEIRLHLLLLT